MLKTKSQMPVLDLHGAFVRRVDLSGVSLRKANLSGADASNAVFRDADFAEARLDGTILNGADLTGAKNLTIEQLSKSIIDHATKLPAYLDREALPPRTDL